MGLGAHSLVTNAHSAAAAGITFTLMRAEDLDAVLEIERRSFPEPWSPGLFLHELKLPFSKTILARAANDSTELLGYICRWLVGDEVHILNVAVLPERRHGGIGRALVESVVHEADAHHARLITLEVRRENTAGIALYRSFGFLETGVRKNYYGRGHDALIMSRSLAVANALVTVARS